MASPLGAWWAQFCAGLPPSQLPAKPVMFAEQSVGGEKRHTNQLCSFLPGMAQPYFSMTVSVAQGSGGESGPLPAGLGRDQAAPGAMGGGSQGWGLQHAGGGAPDINHSSGQPLFPGHFPSSGTYTPGVPTPSHSGSWGPASVDPRPLSHLEQYRQSMPGGPSADRDVKPSFHHAPFGMMGHQSQHWQPQYSPSPQMVTVGRGLPSFPNPSPFSRPAAGPGMPPQLLAFATNTGGSAGTGQGSWSGAMEDPWQASHTGQPRGLGLGGQGGWFGATSSLQVAPMGSYAPPGSYGGCQWVWQPGPPPQAPSTAPLAATYSHSPHVMPASGHAWPGAPWQGPGLPVGGDSDSGLGTPASGPDSTGEAVPPPSPSPPKPTSTPRVKILKRGRATRVPLSAATGNTSCVPASGSLSPLAEPPSQCNALAPLALALAVAGIGNGTLPTASAEPRWQTWQEEDHASAAALKKPRISTDSDRSAVPGRDQDVDVCGSEALPLAVPAAAIGRPQAASAGGCDAYVAVEPCSQAEQRPPLRPVLPSTLQVPVQPAPQAPSASGAGPCAARAGVPEVPVMVTVARTVPQAQAPPQAPSHRHGAPGPASANGSEAGLGLNSKSTSGSVPLRLGATLEDLPALRSEASGTLIHCRFCTYSSFFTTKVRPESLRLSASSYHAT